MGTATTSLRVAVVISAVHVKPGRTSAISVSSVTTTLKLVACDDDVVPLAAWIGLLPISVTLPVKVLPGMASIVTFATLAELHARDVGFVDFDLRLDHRTCPPSVSSTVPALFIVPMTTVSPSSMLRLRHDALDGGLDPDFAEVVAGALERGVSPAAVRSCWVLMFCSCDCRSDWRILSIRLRLLAASLGREAALPEILLAPEGVLGLLRARRGRSRGHAELIGRGAGRRASRPRSAGPPTAGCAGRSAGGTGPC